MSWLESKIATQDLCIVLLPHNAAFTLSRLETRTRIADR